MSLLCALLAALALAVPRCAAAEERDPALLDPAVREAVLRRNIELTVLEDGPTSVVLRLVNRNLLSKETPAYRVQRFVSLPSEAPPRLVTLSARYRLIDYRGNTYTLNAEVAPNGAVTVPRAGLTPLPADLGQFVSVSELSRFRGFRLGTMRIDLARRQQIQEGRDDVLRLDEAVFALVYPTRVDAAASAAYHADPGFASERAFLSSLVVNPSVPPSVDQTEGIADFAEQGRWIELLQAASTRGQLVRFFADAPGVHGVTGAELAAAGVALGGMSPARLRLYHRGTELPVAILGEREALTPESRLLFYAPPLPHPHANYQEAFWIVAEGPPTPPPMRLEPPTTAAPRPARLWQGRLGGEREYVEWRDYERKLSVSGGFSRWFWRLLEMGGMQSMPFEVPATFRGALRTRLMARVAVPIRSQRVAAGFFVNGVLLHTAEFLRPENREVVFDVPVPLLRDCDNVLAMMLYGGRPGESLDRMVLSGFTLAAEWSLRAPVAGEELSLTPPAQGEQIDLVMGDAPPAIAWDISDPRRPTPLRVLTPPAGSGPTCWSMTHGTQRLALADPGQVRRVRGLVVRQAPVDVADRSRAANYLIVHHPEFAEGARKLAEMNARAGDLVVRLLDVEQVYDAFDYGRPGHEAIAAALRYAYRFWPQPKPFYVTLVGEASEVRGDPAALPEGTARNFVPVYDIADAGANLFRADHRYGLLRERDMLPSLVMARLPVSTAAELDGMLEKIRRYREEPTVGPWQLRDLFVADDEPEFNNAVRHVVSFALHSESDTILFDQGQFPYRNLSRVTGAKYSPAATDRLLQYFDEGAMTVNFFGHGGPNVWTHERLFHLDDLPRLANAKFPAFVTCSSCDNAWLDYPLPPVSESMGERLAKMPEGGAIAVFAPTAGGFSTEHRTLLEGLYEGIFQQNHRRVGDATFFSRLTYIERTGQTNITDQFVLLGDPATRLQIPIAEEGLVFEPNFVNAAEGGRVSFRGALGHPVWGWVDIVLKSDVTGEVVQRARFRVQSGFFAGFIPIAPGTLEGRVNALALVYNSSRGYSRLLTGGFEVGEPKLRWEEPLAIHELEVTEDLTQLTFPLTVSNPLPIAIPRALVRVSRAGIDRPIFERRFAFEPGERRQIEFRFVAAPGAYAIRVDLETGQLDSQRRSYLMTLLAYRRSAPVDYVLSESTYELTPPVASVGRYLNARIGLFNAGGDLLPDGSPPPARLTAQLVDVGSGKVLSHPLSFAPPATGSFAELSLISKTPLPTHQAEVALDIVRPAEGGAPAATLRRLPMKLTWARGADLSVVSGSLRFVTEDAHEGNTVFVRGEVTNLGDTASEPFDVTAYVGEAWIPENEVRALNRRLRVSMDPLAPGETREVSVRWDSTARRGEVRLFLVANPDKKVFEQTYANNVAGGILTLFGNPDLLVEDSMTVTPDVLVGEGTGVVVEAEVRNDSDTTLAEVDVEARLRTPLDPSVPAHTQSRTIALAAGARERLRFAFESAGAHSLAEVEVNPRRLVDERETSNNRRSLPLRPVVTAEALETGPRGLLGYGATLRLGGGDDLLLRPDGSLAPSPGALAAVSYVDVGPTIVQRLQPTVDRNIPPDRDNEWLVEAGLIESSPRENAPALRLSIPAGTGRDGLHAVRARVLSEPDRDGSPASHFTLQMEDADTPTSFDFTPDTTGAPRRMNLVDLGVVDLRDGILDAVLDDDVEPRAWATILGFEFAPVLGTYTAPPLDLASLRARLGVEGGEAGLLVAGAAGEGCTGTLSWRAGRRGANGIVQWSDWSAPVDAIGGAPAPFPLDGDLLMWRIEMRNTRTAYSVVDNLFLVPPADLGAPGEPTAPLVP